MAPYHPRIRRRDNKTGFALAWAMMRKEVDERERRAAG